MIVRVFSEALGKDSVQGEVLGRSGTGLRRRNSESGETALRVRASQDDGLAICLDQCLSRPACPPNHQSLSCRRFRSPPESLARGPYPCSRSRPTHLNVRRGHHYESFCRQGCALVKILAISRINYTGISSNAIFARQGSSPYGRDARRAARGVTPSLFLSRWRSSRARRPETGRAQRQPMIGD